MGSIGSSAAVYCSKSLLFYSYFVLHLWLPAGLVLLLVVEDDWALFLSLLLSFLAFRCLHLLLAFDSVLF